MLYVVRNPQTRGCKPRVSAFGQELQGALGQVAAREGMVFVEEQLALAFDWGVRETATALSILAHRGDETQSVGVAVHGYGAGSYRMSSIRWW